MDTIPEIIQIYQDLVQSQQSTYEQLLQAQQSNFYWLLAVFVMLILFFIGASWFFNVKIAKEQLKSETQKIFNETNNLINDFKKEFERDNNFFQAEISRDFYLSLTRSDPASIANRLSYATCCIEYYKRVNMGKRVKTFVDVTLTQLKSAIDIKDEFNEAFKEAYYDYNEILRRIDYIPGELNKEKEEIQQLIKKLKKEDGKKAKPPSKT